MQEHPVDGRWADLVGPRHLAATATVCLGVVLFAFNEFIVATTMPTAVGQFDGVAWISWAVTVHLVASIVGGGAAALLKARYGARTTLVAATVAFLAGSLIVAAADGMPTMLAGRVVQGLGDGVIAALCYALIPELFPRDLTAKVFGAEAVMWAMAAFGGPLIAGWVTELSSWRVAFLLNIPMGAAFLVLVLSIVPHSRSGAAVGTAVPRLAVAGAGILAVSLASVSADPLAQVALILASAAILAGTVAWDRRSPDRLLPRDAFRPGRPVGSGLWVAVLTPVAQTATSVYLVLCLQAVWGYGPAVAGAFNATLALAWSGTGVIVASLPSDDWRDRYMHASPLLVAAGLALIAAGFFSDIVALVLAGQIVTGVGCAQWGYLSQTVMETADEDDRDRASAALPTVQSAGFALGAAVTGLIGNAAGVPEAGDAAAMRMAATTVFATAAVLALPAAAAMATLPKRRRA